MAEPLKFKITLLQGPAKVAEAEGRLIPRDNLTVEDVTDKVIATEQHIEKLLGLRCHIEQVG